MEVNKAHGSLAITTRLENRGNWLLTPKDLVAYNALKDSALPLEELHPSRTERWAVMTKFLLTLSADLLLDVPFITAEQR